MSVQSLQQQILAQGTTGKWSGEGYGSAAENALAMARILDGIGITDINQFGQFEKTTNQQQEVQREMGVYPSPEGDSYWAPTGNYYVADSDGNKTYVDPKYVTQGTRTVESGDGFVDQPVYTANVPVTQTVYGNKATGQAVPNTYSERQTGNAWGGTFAGKGNTGFRVEFAPNGTPYFYTTGASSSDVGGLIPIAALGLSLLAPGVGTAIGSALGASGVAASAIGNAIISGTLAEASGGDFAKGALTGAIGSGVGGLISPEISSALGGGTAGNVAANALTSGALAELQGGDFLTSALKGAVTGGLGEAKLAAQQEAFDNAMTESGLAGQTSVSPSELTGNVIPSTPDYSFVPDYSIPSPVASVIPEMAAQGIQVPTINEVVDVLAGPVDYSLPIPSTNIGLDIPSVLGDPTSFINKPAPDSGVTISDNVPTYQEDISGKLAALDLAKALAPIAIGAITAGSVVDAISGDSEPSGYPILPIPTEWKTPEYNQAFTPSAPINFGNKELLAGTQWANPSLSSVINTLNYQPVPYNQPTYFQPQSQGASGIDSIIGNLDGKQISLADIISGIQSQYGQKTAS